MTTLVLGRLGVDDWFWWYGVVRRGRQEHERRPPLQSREQAGGEARFATEITEVLLFYLQVINSWRLPTCDFLLVYLFPLHRW